MTTPPILTRDALRTKTGGVGLDAFTLASGRRVQLHHFKGGEKALVLKPEQPALTDAESAQLAKELAVLLRREKSTPATE